MRICFRYHSVLEPHQTRITVAPMPPERAPTRWLATAGSPDSIRGFIDWVPVTDSQRFLESFYFQYGHASIADLATP